MTKRIAILGYDRVNALDLAGPMEVFAIADAQAKQTSYEVAVRCIGDRPVRAESGLMLGPTHTKEALVYDTLIIPGGAGLREPQTTTAVGAWIQCYAPTARRIVSVCTGIYGLAPTGLLDGRRVTTHWRFTADIARRYPRLQVEPNAIFIRDGHFYTSAGISSAIDLCLALVEEDLGPSAALAVARELVVYLKRSGGQLQYSEPLHFQTKATDRFADLAAWLPANLNKDLSIEALASRANLGRRQFTRAFTATFGATPAHFVESLRLSEACHRLTTNPAQTLGSVAASLGYASADAFRHAFERRFGVSPSTYRDHFGANTRGEQADKPAPQLRGDRHARSIR